MEQHLAHFAWSRGGPVDPVNLVETWQTRLTCLTRQSRLTWPTQTHPFYPADLTRQNRLAQHMTRKTRQQHLADQVDTASAPSASVAPGAPGSLEDPNDCAAIHPIKEF